MRKIISLITVCATALLSGCTCASVETFKEAADPTPLSAEAKEAWDTIKGGVKAAWGTPDLVYSRSEVPQGVTDCYTATAWRGEKVSAQVLVWTGKNLKAVECTVSDFVSECGSLPSSIAEARFVRYTLADKSDYNCRCARSNGHPVILQADMLDNVENLDIEKDTTRPVWITIDVPADAKAGTYKATVKVSHSRLGAISLPLQLVVIDQVLAEPSEWSFHLDFWQHPSAVARIEEVDLWSEEHFEAMRPLMTMLAEAGQKVITATLNRDPWRYQCFDDYEPMIFWTRHGEKEWSYDYTIFDKWVEFMMECGINKQINCYSMLPWGDCVVDYKDLRPGKDGRNARIMAIPGTPEFEETWGPFLVDFKRHLAEKGWLEITNMAIDERAPKDIDEAARLLKKYAPELGFAMADNHDSYKRYTNMRDVCVGQRHSLMQPEEIAARRAKGDISTFYVCCSTLFPNAFTNSQPYESELLCAYGIAHDYDGMLRWAYNSWPARPEYDSRFRYWASGDTFIVYPGARSSVRFERLIDGVEFSEKVRTLRAKYGADAEALQPLEAKFVELRARNLNDTKLDWITLLTELNEALNGAAAALAK